MIELGPPRWGSDAMFASYPGLRGIRGTHAAPPWAVLGPSLCDCVGDPRFRAQTAPADGDSDSHGSTLEFFRDASNAN
jgi:hypothetical protein